VANVHTASGIAHSSRSWDSAPARKHIFMRSRVSSTSTRDHAAAAEDLEVVKVIGEKNVFKPDLNLNPSHQYR
jgi:hypothetical protein